MNKWGKFALVLMLAIIAGVWLAIGLELTRRWEKPLGPALQLPQKTEKPLSKPAIQATQQQTLPTSTDPAITPAFQAKPIVLPTNTSPVLPSCGGPENMILLVIGSDTRASSYLYGLADVIRLVRIDFANPSVTVLEFPRDLWVDIPDISDHYGITQEKLNQSYLYGNPGMGYYKGPGEGPGLLARTLDLNFGARPDYYIAINMHTFTKLVDTLGGIDVNLSYPVDGRADDQHDRVDLYFKAGKHHLNGRQALMLARLRKGLNADRSTHQSLIACGVRDALLQPTNIQKIPEIISVFQGAVQTDLSPKEISSLACLLPQVPPGNIRFASFPSGLLTSTRIYDRMLKKNVFIYTADFDLLRLYTAAFQNGSWPEKTISNTTTTTSTPGVPGESFTCP